MHKRAWVELFLLEALITAAFRAEAAPAYRDHRNLLYYLDARGDRHAVRSPADWARRVEHIKENMLLVMGRMPILERGVPTMQVVEETRTPAYSRMRIRYTAERDHWVSAYLMVPHDRSTRHPAMLCLPGSYAPGKDVPAGLAGNPNFAYAHELASRGYVTIAIDYPMLHQKDADADPYRLGYESATMKALLNHRRAIDLLQSLVYVDPRRIGVIGHSLGGHNALFLAVFDERIRVVVSSCGFNVFAKHHGGDITAWSRRYYMPLIETRYGNDPRQMPFDFTEVLAALAPRPVFVNAPLHDSPDFEVSGVRDCVDAALPVYQKIFGAGGTLRVEYPDCGHDFPPDVRFRAYEFIARALGVGDNAGGAPK